MSLLSFFEWMQSLSVSAFFLETTWSIPIIQCAHLIAVTVFFGAIFLVDVRLLGQGLIGTPVAQLSRDVEPWLIWSFVVLVVTGMPQLASTALKQYYSPFFWGKMELLLLGVIFTFTIRQKVALADEAHLGQSWPKVVGLVSIGIWAGVAIGARLIGLFS